MSGRSEWPVWMRRWIQKCTVRPDGWVVPCDRLWDFKAGHIGETDFQEIWTSSPIFSEMRRGHQFPWMTLGNAAAADTNHSVLVDVLPCLMSCQALFLRLIPCPVTGSIKARDSRIS